MADDPNPWTDMGPYESPIRKLDEAFSSIDKDGHGIMSTNDLGTVMRLLGHNPTETQLQDMINKIDDGSGPMTFADFMWLMCQQKAKTPMPEKMAMEQVLAASRLRAPWIGSPIEVATRPGTLSPWIGSPIEVATLPDASPKMRKRTRCEVGSAYELTQGCVELR